MINVSEEYICDECGRSEYSDCGNPLHGYEKGTSNYQLCDDCLKEKEDEND